VISVKAPMTETGLPTLECPANYMVKLQAHERRLMEELHLTFVQHKSLRPFSMRRLAVIRSAVGSISTHVAMYAAHAYLEDLTGLSAASSSPSTTMLETDAAAVMDECASRAGARTSGVHMSDATHSSAAAAVHPSSSVVSESVLATDRGSTSTLIKVALSPRRKSFLCITRQWVAC